MRVLSKLMGKQTTALATVQVPSTDLIQGDDELIMPEFEEIECRMETEEFNEYMRLAKSASYFNLALLGESVLQKLKLSGCYRYNLQKVTKLMDKQVICLAKTTELALSWEWIEISKYIKPLPPRILRKINEIKNIITDFDTTVYNGKRLFFWITNIPNIPNLPEKEKQEICFLLIDLENDWTPWASVIDAWRGPTFSDEEAKI